MPGFEPNSTTHTLGSIRQSANRSESVSPGNRRAAMRRQYGDSHHVPELRPGQVLLNPGVRLGQLCSAIYLFVDPFGKHQMETEAGLHHSFQINVRFFPFSL